MKVLVLDTSAFIMGLDPQGLHLDAFSVPEVVEELKEVSPSYRLAASSSSGKLKIQSPTSSAMKEVANKANSLGDKRKLSKADSSILALALDLQRDGKTAIIVSDDYAVQNVAEEIGLSYQSLATGGIRQKFKWVYYCPACFKRYSSDVQVCTICGTKLRRKISRKEDARMST